MATSDGRSPQPLVTVAILTFNGEQYLDRILSSLERQSIDGDVEVLVIDSGSTDRTLEIVSQYSFVRLHEIDNSDFGHGRTRNLAVKLARGEFIAFLTHDAIPADEHWLRELLAPFAISDRIVGVMGKQVPRAACFPLMKYEIRDVFAGFGPDFGTSIFYNDGSVTDEGTLSALSFYSDVNSAARRDFLATAIPYQDVRYAEDQLFGRDVINAGYMKAYAPRGAVEHSNDLTFREFGYRIFDETVGLRRAGVTITRISRLGALARAARGAVRDGVRIVRDRSYSPARAAYWLVVNPFFHLRKWQFYYRAAHADLENESAIDASSLEARRAAT